ncbi:MAG TPA: SAM-dependent methyltransferase [Dehalococcoidia bacterium]
MTFDAITMTPVAVVVGGRYEPIDDGWGGVEAEIRLDASRFKPDVFAGLADFSHIEVVYVFDRVNEADINYSARHPREREDWPLVGIFAQRARLRPNRIGVSVCELLTVEGLVLRVRGLDAIDGTPVLDIKPYMSGFAPRGNVREPDWVGELMANYW